MAKMSNAKIWMVVDGEEIDLGETDGVNYFQFSDSPRQAVRTDGTADTFSAEFRMTTTNEWLDQRFIAMRDRMRQSLFYYGVTPRLRPWVRYALLGGMLVALVMALGGAW